LDGGENHEVKRREKEEDILFKFGRLVFRTLEF
jgi:hypothetical protein